MRAALRAALAAAAAGMALAAWPVAASAAPDGSCDASPAAADEKAMTRMIAADRRAKRLGKVRRTAKLWRAGRAKSVAMARGGAFAHSAAGLPWAKGRAAGQNIAMAPTARAAFRAMIKSPGHRANIRAREWRFAAVGAARGCDGLVYFTINFMGPPVR